MADIIHVTRTSAPSLLPLFRSPQQLKLLGELFVRAREPMSIGELSEATGIPQATVSREVARLSEAGVLRTSVRGRLRLVEANDRLPYHGELRSLLLKTIGPAAALEDHLAAVDGVEEVYIFGSWAARYHGQPGPPPGDIDVLVVGAVDLDDVYAACRRAEADLRLDVNPVVRTAAEWRRRDRGFLDAIRKGPLVPVGSLR